MAGPLRGLRRRASSWLARVTAPDRYPDATGMVWMPVSRVAGVWLTADEAVRISALWACCSVITKSIAGSVWEVFVEDAEGDRTFRRSTPLWRLLNVQPNPEMTAFDWREAAVWQALLGNHYSEIERNALGQPVALWPLDRDRSRLTRNETTGALELRVLQQDGGEVFLPYRDVFHLHGPSPAGLVGYDLVALASRVLGQAVAADEFGGAFFANGTNMGGVLSTTGKLSEEDYKTLREKLAERHGGPRNAFGVLLLQGGEAKFQPFAPKGDEAQIIETRQHLIEEICRWFGVPPHKIAHLLRSTFNNIEQQGLEFTRDALTPWCERLRQQAGAKLIVRRDVGTRIDIDWLAEGDAKSKAETDAIEVNNGLATRNEVRRRRGRNSIGPEGDLLTVQGQMIPLERVGSQSSSSPDALPSPAPDAPPAPDAGAAARALFAVAARRSLRRLELRALDAARAAGGDHEDFARRLEAMRADAAQYLVDQVGEQIAVLERLGLRVPPLDFADMAAAFARDDLDQAARWRGGAGAGTRLALVTEARAEEIAGALAAVLTERIAA